MIVDRSEILAVLGLAANADPQTLGLVNLIHPMAERAVKQAVQCNLESATYTHYLPVRESVLPRDAFLDGSYDIQGGQAVQIYGRFVTGDRLALPEIPVRSVSRVCIDLVAWAGQATGAFPSTGDIIQGTHYYVDWRSQGISATGQLVRIASAWPQIPSSVLVTYTAGYTRAELDGDPAQAVNASELKQAVLLTFMTAYNTFKVMQQGAQGPLVRTRLGNWSAEYDPGGRNVPTTSGFHVTIPPAAKDILQPYINYNRILAN